MFIYLECNNKDIDIDIIMLAYNHEKYIKQAIESVLQQRTKYRYRILIGEDASTDNTRQIVTEYYEKYSDKIALILWKANVGGRKNFQQLTKMCQAKYVAILEGDDYWTNPLKLEKQITFLEQHDEFVGTAHNVRCVDAEGKFLHKDFDAYPMREEHVYGINNALHYELVAQTASIVYRNFWKTWNDEQFAMFEKCCANGDQKISVLLGILGNVFYFRDIMADHRIVFEGSSWTARMNNKNLLEFVHRNEKEIKELISTLSNTEYDFSDSYKYILEEAFITLFRDFNRENIGVCLKLIKEKRNKRR